MSEESKDGSELARMWNEVLALRDALRWTEAVMKGEPFRLPPDRVLAMITARELAGLPSHPVPVCGSQADASAGAKPEATFTRSEVLTVLRTMKAAWGVHGSEAYDMGAKRMVNDLLEVFQKME